MLVNLVPQLIQIDGKEITPQERIESSQNFDDLLDAMYDEIERLDIIGKEKITKFMKSNDPQKARKQTSRSQKSTAENTENKCMLR